MQILKYEGLKYGNEKDKIYGLLFDGAWLWEEYLNTILKKLNFIHPENNIRKKKLKLFANSRSLYPDFYNIKKSMVIDAKYKRLQKDGSLKREDIYQLTTYMYRLKAKSGFLLFPSNLNDNQQVYEMNEDRYGGKEALFIKYGLNVPQETNGYKLYMEHFRMEEYNLLEYIKEPAKERKIKISVVLKE